MEPANLDIMIPTLNEERNLPFALESVAGWTRKVFVLDSGSTDKTEEIGREAGAEIVHQDWLGYARQKNWGLDNLPFESDWIFILDADEMILPELRNELIAITSRPLEEVKEAGYYINRFFIFLGKRIRHCGYYPSWNLRFFRHGRAHYEERSVHEHMIVDGPCSYLKGHMQHHDRRGFDYYNAKHNHYAALEAHEIFKQIYQPDNSLIKARLMGNPLERRRWLKRYVYPRLPARWLLRFIYMYIFRLGVLDGLTGLHFCLFISSYEQLIHLRMMELRRGLITENAKNQDPSQLSAPVEGQTATFAVPKEKELPRPSVTKQEGPPRSSVARNRELSRYSLASRGALPDVGGPVDLLARQQSPWTTRDKIARMLWAIVERILFRFSFRTMYRWRSFLLRCFGARIGRNCIIRRTVRVEVPWHLSMGDYSTIGDECIVYTLGRVTIGDRVTISQYTHLCAGTHDHTRPDFPLIRPPIIVEDDVWIAADVFIGPNVRIGRGTLVGARASVFKDLPPWKVCVGNPAHPVKDREYQGRKN